MSRLHTSDTNPPRMGVLSHESGCFCYLVALESNLKVMI